LGRRRKGRDISGLLLFDKPSGMTSNAALQRVRRLYDANKAGHTGTLDPLATGLLPLCFGEATKFASFLLDSAKTYRVLARFGQQTDTGDTDGDILSERDASALQRAQLESALIGFLGIQDQVPPRYSAIKLGGKPLYEYARLGQEVELAPRTVEIFTLVLEDFQPGSHPEAWIKVVCSKGTYVRSLVQDLGEVLGPGATVAGLRRLTTGLFSIENAVSLENLEQASATERDQLLRPMEHLVDHLPEVELDPASAHFFAQGQAVMLSGVYRFGAEGDIVRVFRAGGAFLGIGTLTDDLRIQPKRLRSDI
jgi:tRNA pseudouridine55 synthase